MSVQLRTNAINAFITGCKADGTWDAIKSACILAGWNGITGALVPLKGTAPTNFNFVAGDYSRTTGLLGNGTTKYLNSNRNNNADPQNSQHLAVYQTVAHTRNATRCAIGTGSGAGASHLITAEAPGRRFFRMRNTATTLSLSDTTNSAGLWGGSRSNSTQVIGRIGGANYTFDDASSAPLSENILVFSRTGSDFLDGRLAFYSIGESLDLALLDARVTTLITTLGAVP
jgi:hypothetical protein